MELSCKEGDTIITVEKKIELFSKMVTEKNLSEDIKTLKELNQKHAQILDNMEAKCQKQREAYLANIEEKAKEKKRRMISRTQSDVENQVIVKKHNLLKQYKSEIMDAVRKESLTENYKLYFKKRFDSAIADIEDHDDLVIGVKADDIALVPSNYKTEINNQLIGGFYIIKDSRVKYDFTLNSEVDRINEYLVCSINSLFEATGEVCNEE
ncbi:hypothetical protein JCM19376_38440 [Fusibacter bizertensis]